MYAAPEVKAVLNDDAASSELGPHSSTFWIMVAALKAFVVRAHACVMRGGVCMCGRMCALANACNSLLADTHPFASIVSKFTKPFNLKRVLNCALKQTQLCTDFLDRKAVMGEAEWVPGSPWV